MKVFVTIVIFSAIILENVDGRIQPAVDPISPIGPIPVACTQVYLICPQGQQLGTGTDGCAACVPCPQVMLIRCWDGSTPKQNPPVQNKCLTYSCPPCIGQQCLQQIQPIKEIPVAV